MKQSCEAPSHINPANNVLFVYNLRKNSLRSNYDLCSKENSFGVKPFHYKMKKFICYSQYQFLYLVELSIFRTNFYSRKHFHNETCLQQPFNSCIPLTNLTLLLFKRTIPCSLSPSFFPASCLLRCKRIGREL